MLVIGLTGNIGCGKSSLSKILKENSLDIIDADIISREIMNDQDILESVFETFGNSVKSIDGTLDRKKLGDIVFNSDEKLLSLNNITHPAIKNKIKKNIIDISMLGKNVAIVDAALLIEGGFLDIVDKLIVVTCNGDIQLNRVMKRDNLGREEVINRINSQMNQNEKAKFADYIIDNSGDINELEYEAKKLLKCILENWIE